MQLGRSAKVVMAEEVADLVIAEARRKSSLETGGILIGCWLASNLAYIHRATGPGPSAIHNTASFVYDAGYCQQQLGVLYSRSDGSFSYIGDWHSHLRQGLKPSPVDRQAMIQLSKDPESRCPCPFLLLTNGIEIAAFLLSERPVLGLGLRRAKISRL